MHLVLALPIRRQMTAAGPFAHPMAATLVAVLSVGAIAAPRGHCGQQTPGTPEGRALFDRVWAGVQGASHSVRNGCGTITERRTSPLLARPLMLKGTFCASGTTAFRLDYTEPEPLRIIYNQGVLNVTTEAGHRTEVIEIGSAVERTQRYFSGPHALENLRRDFVVTATEQADSYSVTLIPISGRLVGRLRQVVARVGRDDCVLRGLEIRASSGVESSFEVNVDRRNIAIDPEVFKVYHPGAQKDPIAHDGH